MPVKTTTVADYGGFGRALHITNGTVEAYASIDRGPRVLHFGFCGGENLLWTDTDGSGLFEMPGLDETFGRGGVYAIMGGHRLWVSPEHPVHSYYPDTDPVDVRELPGGALLTPPAQERLDLGLSVELRMAEDGAVTLRHRVKNTGLRPVRLAAWAITQLAPGGTLTFPQSKADTGLLADRSFSIWPYTDMGDVRLRFADDYIEVTQDTSNARALKIGTYNRHGRAEYRNRGAVFTKTWTPVEGAEYPDSGCCFEVYTDRRFIEMETLSPLHTLAPGEECTHDEEWIVDEQFTVDN